MSAALEVWTWPTPNGRKVVIMLEECGLPYDVHPVNIRKGEQLTREYRDLNPNTKIPTLRDNDPPGGSGPMILFESGAILEYLAERAGRFLPTDFEGRWRAKQWLMFQHGGIGPMHGQGNHFCRYTAEEHPYSRKRYRDEARRLYRVADRHLGNHDWFAGAEYSIADMAVYPWTQQMDRIETDIADFPNLARWADAMAARPGVRAGMEVLTDVSSSASMTDAEREIMFGEGQLRAQD